jgi:hypothetical protein
MNPITESSLYFLVVYGRGDDPVFAFLGMEPNPDQLGGLSATPVVLELLPLRQRFGGFGGVAMGATVLGRWPDSRTRFRQFLTLSEMEQAGWIQVSRYRICDSWEDFQSPWSGIVGNDQSTDGDSQVWTGR